MAEITDWYSDPQYLQDNLTKLAEGEATYGLREAWKRIYGDYPSNKSLALLWAQSALETGRWKSIHCWNFGNIKKVHNSNDKHYFTMYRCNEIINGRVEWFNPPHPQTHFCAYKSVVDGAEDYIRFLSQRTRYAKAWKAIIAGDPHDYSHQLKVAGYYTANEASYTAGVVSLTNEFLRKSNDLLAWAPPEASPVPSPQVVETSIGITVPVEFEEPLDSVVPVVVDRELSPEPDKPEPEDIPDFKNKGLLAILIAFIAKLFGK